MSENEEESILSKEDRKVLRDLKLMTSPYSEIAEQNLQLLDMLAESEVNKETIEDASKELLQIIDEKDRELVYKCKQLQEQESKLTDVNKQLIEEKGRVDATKSLLKKEIAKRKKLINEAVPTEQEIDRELEE